MITAEFIKEKDKLTPEQYAEKVQQVKEFAEKSGCKFPWEPAHDLDEAFQSIWLTYECIIFSELVPYSYSWGRMDQYLLPFAAEADEEELTEKFVHFFRFLEQVNFTDDASALNVGGPEGFNRVSRAIIEAVARNKSTTPMLAVRIPDHLPPEEWKRSAEQHSTQPHRPNGEWWHWLWLRLLPGSGY